MSIAQTVKLSTPNQPPELASNSSGTSRSTIERTSVSLGRIYAPADSAAAAGVRPAPGLDALLERQRRAPLPPPLYGEKPGVAPPGNQILKARGSEGIDPGKEGVVLFFVGDVQDPAVE